MVRLSVSVSWGSAYQLARIAGDVAASPSVGGVSIGAGQVLGVGPLIHYGTPAGGSVLGVDIAGENTGLPGWTTSPIEFLRLDWTAPTTPGVVAFDLVPRPDAPDVRFYLSPHSVAFHPFRRPRSAPR